MRSSGPVIAVLPFKVDAGTQADGIIAHGIVEDLSGELSRFPALEVIAPMSGLAVGDLAETEAAGRLGATHVLRGRLGVDGERLRLSATLVDGHSGAQLWNERMEATGGAVFDLQEELVARVAATLSARLEGDLLRRARAKPTESLTAYELTLRGLAMLRQGTFEADEAARALFARALEIDPHYARAHGGLSLSWFNEWSCQFWDRFEENGRLAFEHAHRALELDDSDAMLHLIIGRILLYRREFERAAWYLDRALALCPNDAELLIQLVLSEVYLGRAETAIAHAQKAMRLNPYHPNHYFAYAAFPHFVRRDFARALETADKAAGVPIIDIPAYSAIACAHTGRWDEARHLFALFNEEFRKRITRGRAPAPGEGCRWVLDVNPFRRQQDIDLVVEGFRMLGDEGVVSAPGATVHAAPAAAADASPAAQVLRRDGHGWRVCFGGEWKTIADLKGVRDILRLLARPGEAFHCLDLAARQEGASTGEAVLDERARHAVKTRIRDLQEELAEAEERNDTGRAETLRAELDRLVEELSRALGLGGRGRRMGDLAERARSAVTWRIRHAIRIIAKAHPSLGRHLANSIRTGTFCSYQPERPCRWEIVE
ncbi:tetratricopeptide repeat protein [Chelativorans intermedius]|uniref:Tetratricopeptide repeat protein n=1 Tax=Chelativorans intermedius TaxID=515947 RepID=A0ABV6D5K8_9HYPH|nr:hypothetical protein [Chelativorans intermedius]MCT8998831.1 hypothetical protein [Chelativorans intermedius]